MLNFSIDSTAKTITAEILLKGEREPIKLTLSGYELNAGAGGQTQLSVREAVASREWLTVLLNEFVVGKPHELPPSAVPLLRLLL